MHVKSIAECSKGSILQYFGPSSCNHLSLRSLFCLFLNGHVNKTGFTVDHMERKNFVPSHTVESGNKRGCTGNWSHGPRQCSLVMLVSGVCPYVCIVSQNL